MKRCLLVWALCLSVCLVACKDEVAQKGCHSADECGGAPCNACVDGVCVPMPCADLSELSDLDDIAPWECIDADACGGAPCNACIDGVCVVMPCADVIDTDHSDLDGGEACSESTCEGSVHVRCVDGQVAGREDCADREPAAECRVAGCLVATAAPGRCAEIAQEVVAVNGPVVLVAPGENGLVSVDGTETTLRQVVATAEPGSTLLLLDGTYTFAEASGGSYTGLYITTPGLTLRSTTGDAAAVILDSNYADHGGETGPITVAAPGVTLANFTVQRSIFHLIHVWRGGDDLRVHNVRLVDGGQQFLKSSPGSGQRISGGAVTCSHFLMTEQGRRNVWGYGPADGYTRCYTGGIDTHDSDGWTITDNLFEGIYCDGHPHPEHGKKREGVAFATYTGGLAEHAIHMWAGRAEAPHLIARNRIVNCARGIGLGMGDTLRVQGGLVMNNALSTVHPGGPEHDVGIILEGAQDVAVYNNTLYFHHPEAYANAIELRFGSSSGARVMNNLSNRAIRLRDGATAEQATNVSEAAHDWFVDAAAGDLRLADCANAAVVAAGTPLAEVIDDLLGQPRGAGAPDLGAFQCGGLLP